MCCRGSRRSVAEAWASRRYRSDQKLQNKEIAVWWRRLAYDLGYLVPVPSGLPRLPASALPEAHLVRAGISLLMGVRRIDWVPEPVPFALRFGEAWTGISKHKVAAGREQLQKYRVIEPVGTSDETLVLYEAGPGRAHHDSGDYCEAESHAALQMLPEYLRRWRAVQSRSRAGSGDK